MKKRICSLLLICSMLAGLLPQIVLPQAAAADSSTTGSSNGFGLPTEEKNNLRDKATLKTNPYGTLGWVPLFQNHELVVAGVDSDEFQTTYEGAANGKGSKMSTFRWSNSTDVGNAERGYRLIHWIRHGMSRTTSETRILRMILCRMSVWHSWSTRAQVHCCRATCSALTAA